MVPLLQLQEKGENPVLCSHFIGNMGKRVLKRSQNLEAELGNFGYRPKKMHLFEGKTMNQSGRNALLIDRWERSVRVQKCHLTGKPVFG